MRVRHGNTIDLHVNTVSIYLTLMVPAENSRTGQDAYFTHTAATGLDYATAARTLKGLKEMMAKWDEADGIDYRIDLHRDNTRIHRGIALCWYCDARPALWDMDCDGPYLTSTCERCTGLNMGHFGCDQRDSQKVYEMAKYHMPCPNWYMEDMFANFLGHPSYRNTRNW